MLPWCPEVYQPLQEGETTYPRNSEAVVPSCPSQGVVGGGRAGGRPDRQVDGPAAGTGAWTSSGCSLLSGWSSRYRVRALIASSARRIRRLSR